MTRNGDLVVINVKKESTSAIVNLTDNTKIEREKSFRLRRADMDVTAMVPGLTITAEGVGNSKGQLDANKVTFNPDTFAIEVRGDDARRLRLQTLSQSAQYTPQWRAGFGYEFMERPDGYKGLVSTYGLRFAAPPRIMDLGLLTRALKEHQVDLIAGNMTDGLIPALDLFVLADDKHYFPPYEAVPVIRQQTLDQHPEIGPALNSLGNKISDEEMRRLNYEVDGKKRDVKEVVREFLTRKNLD